MPNRGIKNYQAVDIGGLTTKVTSGGRQLSMCLFVNSNVALKPETHADSPFLKAKGFIIHKCWFIKIYHVNNTVMKSKWLSSVKYIIESNNNEMHI